MSIIVRSENMRRFVAFITFLALMSSTFVSASAATITSSDNFHSETVSILGT